MTIKLTQITEEIFKATIDNSYIILSIENDELIVDNLFVSADERGNKLGYKLLDMAVTKAKELGLTLSLYASPDEDDALDTEGLVAYYRDYGFESDPDCDQLMTY